MKALEGIEEFNIRQKNKKVHVYTPMEKNLIKQVKGLKEQLKQLRRETNWKFKKDKFKRTFYFNIIKDLLPKEIGASEYIRAKIEEMDDTDTVKKLNG